MKKTDILRVLTWCAAAMSLPLLTASCSMMQDDRSDCPDCKNPLRVVLKYDYNIQRDDMFNGHVGAAVCYVADAQNRIVARQYAENNQQGQPLRDASFAFNFEGLDEGSYRLLAVAAQRPFSQLGQGGYEFNDLNEGDDITTLRLHMPRATSADGEGHYEVPHAVQADTVWHAMSSTPVTVTATAPAQETLSLVRDMNNLNIMLHQTQDPADNSADDYVVRIVDQNGLLDYDNSPMADLPLVYLPYEAWTTVLTDESNASTAPTRAQGDVIERVAHFDLSLGRLIPHANATDNARLQIFNRADGRKIVDIDLIYYLSMARSAAERNYSSQEFLDREYSYRLSFLLEGNRWRSMDIGISLNITSWALHIENAQI